MLPYLLIALRAYTDESGNRPYEIWVGSLDHVAAAKVAVAMARMESGNFSNTKGVGRGVHEYRIDFGPGYRLYFGRDGETLIILLGGGTKKRQQRDIAIAQAFWMDYKRRKKQER